MKNKCCPDCYGQCVQGRYDTENCTCHIDPIEERINQGVTEMRRRFPIIFKVAKMSVDLGENADTTVAQAEHVTDEDLKDFIRSLTAKLN